MLGRAENGAVIRQFVGYDRYEGEAAYRQLVEVYRALRLYVNFFQPSLKLKEKHREGTSVRRTYAPAQTPFERVSASGILTGELQTRLDTIFEVLDPMRLLNQIGHLQDALWQHAVVRSSEVAAPQVDTPLRFAANACGLTDQPAPAQMPAPPILHQKRVYQHKQSHLPRWWRTRVDPFADVWTEIEQWLESNPTRTAKSVFVELQQREPDRYPDAQLRALQRRIAKWRATMITTFDDQVRADDARCDLCG